MGSDPQPLAPSQIAGKAPWSWRKVAAEAEEDSSRVREVPSGAARPGRELVPQRVGSDGEAGVTGTGTTETQAAINEGSQR